MKEIAIQDLHLNPFAVFGKEELFTLSHFPEQYRKALGYLGSHSGRDGDKVNAAGLTPVFADGTTYSGRGGEPASAFAGADEYSCAAEH